MCLQLFGCACVCEGNRDRHGLHTAFPCKLPLLHLGWCQNGLSTNCATCHPIPRGLLPVQPSNTEVQPQLDCYHTNQDNTFHWQNSLFQLTLVSFTPKLTIFSDLSMHSFPHFLNLKYISTTGTYVRVGHILVSVVSDDIITGVQKIGYPLKGNLWTHLQAWHLAPPNIWVSRLALQA